MVGNYLSKPEAEDSDLRSCVILYQRLPQKYRHGLKSAPLREAKKTAPGRAAAGRAGV